MKIATEEQIADAAMLVERQYAALLSEPGTGKTLTAITALVHARPLHTLIIVPRIALRQWADELADAHVRCVEICRSTNDIKNAMDLGLQKRPPAVIVTTYSLATRNVRILNKWQPDCVILDEAHALSNADAARTQAVYGQRCRRDAGSLTEHATYIWPMTGSPILTFPINIWPMMRALWPERLEQIGAVARARFDTLFSVYAEKRIGNRIFTQLVGGRNEDQLRGVLYAAPKAIARRRLTDVDTSLPSRRERVLEVCEGDVRPTFLTALDDEEAREPLDEEGLVERLFENSEALGSLRQALGLCVADAAEERILNDLDEPTLVLFWHRAVGEHLRTLLSDSRLIYGGTPAGEAEQIVADFQAGHCKILLGQIATMGTAINLQASCRRVIFIERIGSPALMEQAIRRVWRWGQTEGVQVDYVRLGHPLENATDQVLARKSESQAAALGDTK